jgi:hypothetical protein
MKMKNFNENFDDNLVNSQDVKMMNQKRAREENQTNE